jgi:hypothetical protein
MKDYYTYRDKNSGKSFNTIWNLLDYLPDNCPCTIQRIRPDGTIDGEQENLECIVENDGLDYHFKKIVDGEPKNHSMFLERDRDGNRKLKPLNK